MEHAESLLQMSTDANVKAVFWAFAVSNVYVILTHAYTVVNAYRTAILLAAYVPHSILDVVVNCYLSQLQHQIRVLLNRVKMVVRVRQPALQVNDFL